MDVQGEPANYPTAPFEEPPAARGAAPAIRWVKEWCAVLHLPSILRLVPQDLVATGGKCMVLKWVREDMLKAMQEKLQEPEAEEPEPEPTTEVLFLCSFEGCGKTFVDVAGLKKHAHVHGEKQYICHYEGCGKKFLDSSKLKRHFLIHTGERAYMCTYEGCGKAFSLDFNLRAHMRTHSQENYHVCPHEDCGKRFAHLYKLQAHIKAQHEKNAAMNTMKHIPAEEKVHVPPKPAAVVFSDRPYACPYEGCGKSYIHEYKLKLHLRREHPGHNLENGKRIPAVEHDMDDAGEHDAHLVKGVSSKSSKRNKHIVPSMKASPPLKVVKKASTSTPTTLNVAAKQWPTTKEMYEEDSEETEEDCENAEDDGWRYQGTHGDDEETEDEE